VALSDSKSRHVVGAWIVPTSSVDSSGFVPMKSKFRHRTVSDSACSPSTACWRESAAVRISCAEGKEKENRKKMDEGEVRELAAARQDEAQ